jgi:hypothetical protein
MGSYDIRGSLQRLKQQRIEIDESYFQAHLIHHNVAS